MNTIIVSDIHIGDPRSRVNDFLNFLSATEAKRVIIAGDLWELWLRNPSWLRKNCDRVINIFNILGKTGTKFEYVLGNHDEDYLKDPLIPLEVMPVVDHSSVELMGGKTLAVIHGHAFDKYLKEVHWLYKLGYKFKMFRKLACPSWWNRCAFIPPDTRSEFSRMMTEIHIQAEETYKKLGYDGVIMGHTHLPAETPYASGFLFFNCGDWLDDHASYVQVENGHIALRGEGTLKPGWPS